MHEEARLFISSLKEEEVVNYQAGNMEHELEVVEGNADNYVSECPTFCGLMYLIAVFQEQSIRAEGE